VQELYGRGRLTWLWEDAWGTVFFGEAPFAAFDLGREQRIRKEQKRAVVKLVKRTEATALR